MYFNETIEKKFSKTFGKSKNRASSLSNNSDGIHITSIKIEGKDGPMVFLVNLFFLLSYYDYIKMLKLKGRLGD
jgi:hypothetical protein